MLGDRRRYWPRHSRGLPPPAREPAAEPELTGWQRERLGRLEAWQATGLLPESAPGNGRLLADQLRHDIAVPDLSLAAALLVVEQFGVGCVIHDPDGLAEEDQPILALFLDAIRLAALDLTALHRATS